MITDVPDRVPSADDLTALLERVANSTEALRRAPANEKARLASRMLLDDLAGVTRQFRGTTTAVGASLSAALEDLRRALDGASDDAN